jgi:hypothetical protein
MLLTVAQVHGRDWGFFYWAGVGFLVVFGFITGFSIGLPILALGVVLFVVMLRRGPGWPADLGLLAGAGLVCLVIAMINVISGSLSPTIWAIVGAALTVGSCGAFWWLRCRPGVSRHSRGAPA